jgi:predicted ABC-type ATPase
MSKRSPSVIILAGPNGAGKTTFAPRRLKGSLGVSEFVNTNVIVQGFSGFAPERAATAAAEIMLLRLREPANRLTAEC